MAVILKVSMLLLCVGLVASEQALKNLARTADLSLMKFLVDSRQLQEINPQRSAACFEYYIPVLTECSNTYETNYNGCISTANQAKDAVDVSTQPDREQIERSSKDACEAMNVCSDNADSVSYFGCYMDAGSANTKNMYAISNSASDILDKINEQYRVIDNDQSNCTTKANRAYVQDTDSTYDEMQKCLSGASPVPTKPPATDAPTEETTTDGPVTIEPNPTPEEPEVTTEEPEVTPEEPEVTPEEPEVTPEEPEVTSEEPEVTPEEPEVTPEEPEVTPEAPEPESSDEKMPEEDLFRASRNRLAQVYRKLRFN